MLPYLIVILTAMKFFAYKFERKLYWSLIGPQEVELYSLLKSLLEFVPSSWAPGQMIVDGSIKPARLVCL